MCVATACTNVLPFSGVEKVTWTALLPCGASAMGMREGFMVAALVVRGLQCLETVELGLAGLLKRSRVVASKAKQHATSLSARVRMQCAMCRVLESTV